MASQEQLRVGRRIAELDQLGQVAFERMERNAAHGNRLAGRLAACGQGDIEQLGCFLRVFVEDLVEVTHAKHKKRVGVVFFNFRLALILFVIGWILQFIGHAIEGKPPAFFKNPIYLLVGPIWWLKKFLGTKAR